MVVEDIKVELLDHMGDDLAVVNAARVSFSKEKTALDDKDVRLIDYLAKHNHWSPFGHVTLKIRVGAPIFLARQLVKHQVGLVWNEESRRYISNRPTFYVPETFHKAPLNAKQGSGDVFTPDEEYDAAGAFYGAVDGCLETYEQLLDMGMAPEEARMVLPLNTMTHWIWTGTLAAFVRVYKLRVDSHAQLAAQEFARKLHAECYRVAPHSWDALCRN